MIRTIDKDLGYKAIYRNVALLEKKPMVKVGYIGSKRRDGDPMTNAEVAAVNEFGTEDGRVPERSFMRSTFDEKKGKWSARTKKFHSAILMGKETIQHALEFMGVVIKSDIQKKITSNIPPENADSTVARKIKKGGPNVKTLIDTGQLLNGITQQVVMDGRGEKSGVAVV